MRTGGRRGRLHHDGGETAGDGPVGGGGRAHGGSWHQWGVPSVRSHRIAPRPARGVRWSLFPPRPLVVARPRAIEGPGYPGDPRRRTVRSPALALVPRPVRPAPGRSSSPGPSIVRARRAPAGGRPTDERRPMPTQAKAAVIDEITERFQNSSAAVLTEYRGLTVAQLTQLRRSLGEGSSYAVVKNTLTKRAADSVGFSDLPRCSTARPRSPSSKVTRSTRRRPSVTSRGPTPRSSSRVASSRAARSTPARSPASPTSRAVRCCWPSWPAR